jgi:hypothetical protein
MSPPELPARYYHLLDAGIERVEKMLDAAPAPTLEALEAAPGCRHFPSALLMAAVPYAHPHPANRRKGDARLLALARRVGDLLVEEHARGRYASRLDHHRDIYMWLEAYRLLERELGEERRAAWQKALLENLAPLAASVEERREYPRYQAPFISTSPNHYALWASTLYLGARVFTRPEWERLAAQVLHRFAAEEQAPDGYWGEHNDAGPTTGYDYLTCTGVALYWEHSQDPAALEALRHSTRFHSHYTYPDGTPVETINDRNRYWGVSMWGHFGFSHFPEGRRYAEFLTRRFAPDLAMLDWPGSAAPQKEGPPRHYEGVDLESLGRIAQNALYYHEGELAPIPLDQPCFVYQMEVPAGIRKHGPWVVCLSGLIDPPTTNRFFLDRQGHVSVFHEKTGLIVTGANSKRQPELATFVETTGGRAVHTPISSRLEMNDQGDHLALAYNSFFAVLEIAPGPEAQLALRIRITPTGRIAEARLTLQLVLKPGQPLETGTGLKSMVDETRIDWSEAELKGSLRHHGWALRLPAGAGLSWPRYPFNPYLDGPETALARAVGTVTVPLGPGAQEIPFVFEVE